MARDSTNGNGGHQPSADGLEIARAVDALNKKYETAQIMMARHSFGHGWQELVSAFIRC